MGFIRRSGSSWRVRHQRIPRAGWRPCNHHVDRATIVEAEEAIPVGTPDPVQLLGTLDHGALVSVTLPGRNQPAVRPGAAIGTGPLYG
jgi:hypothetical protein